MLQILDQTIFGVSHRIELATLFTVSNVHSSEAYQIANYGMGGQYYAHVDAHGYFDQAIDQKEFAMQYNHNKLVGDRIATVMGYLSDVEYGGRTAFPLIGNVVDVKRGDTVMWFNIMSDGRTDRRTYHGGCPVLIGSKWITNKWIFSNDQFKNYPCSVDFDRPYDGFNKWKMSFY